MDVVSIYYNDTTNCFEDEEGYTEYNISDIMSYTDIIYYKRVGGVYHRNLPEDGIIYEIVFPKPYTDRILYYDANENTMEEEHGIIVFNIFSIISPSSLYLFKQKQQTLEVRGVLGGRVVLVWPEIE